jgi:hypothetical protein
LQKWPQLYFLHRCKFLINLQRSGFSVRSKLLLLHLSHQQQDHPMKTDAECERSIQAQKLIDLFEDVHGRPAISARELVDWAASPEGQAAIAADHREEIFSRARQH